MIHTIYSNSYEVLRAVLLSNIDRLRLRPEAEELSPDECFAGVFDRVPVIIPSKAVEVDLSRAIAHQERICAGMQFMFLSQWLGFFSKDPLANVVGNEADWMIWQILRETGPGSLREEVAAQTTRLEDSLVGRSDMEIFALAQRIARVFVSYSSYRLDWVLEWLGLHQDRLTLSPDMRLERAELQKDPDLVWQRALWQRLATSPTWRGKYFLESLPDTLEGLTNISPDMREIEVAGDRKVALPNALHVFCPFSVPPLMLPVLKAYAHSGRDVWLYLLNPCAEYWFDLVPRRLFRWHEEEKKRTQESSQTAQAVDDHREVGHPILADNGRSVRANIDRLWRFTATDEAPMRLLAGTYESTETEEQWREMDVETHEQHILSDGKRFLREWQENPKAIEADLAVDVQSFYLESNESTLLRRIQDSILNLRPQDLERAPELVRDEDESLRFVRAPTPVRELEGLVDWLHARFEADKTLRPEDVLVVTPDIATMAPLVDQVFGSLPEGRRISYRLTGVPNEGGDASLGVLTGLVSLISGRMRRTELVNWLALPIVSKRFRLDGDDLETLSGWLEAAGMDFGLSDGHLLALDPVTFAQVREGTFERALERLTLGAMLPSGPRTPMGDTLPIDGGSSVWTTVAERPKLLATLSTIFAALENLRRLAQDPVDEQAARNPERWTTWLARALESVFPRETAEEDWKVLRTAANTLADEIAKGLDDAGRIPEVPFTLFFKVLESHIQNCNSSARPGNGVTFTGIQQMRGLPWRIIVVVGLGEDSRFPGVTRTEEFDLMSRHPRRGDRDSRSDNRNIFLDLLLAARDTLLISWSCGTNPVQPKEPSVVAKELRDWIVSIGTEAGPASAALRAERMKRLTRTLPLTRFSTTAFEESEGHWRSTDSRLLEAVKVARKENWAAAEPRFADNPIDFLSANDKRTVMLEALCDYWTAPERWFLRMHDIHPLRDNATTEMPFMPDTSGLSIWSRRNEYLNDRLKDIPEEEILARWCADPKMGAKGVREWALESDLGVAKELVKVAQEELGRCEPLHVAPRGVTLPQKKGRVIEEVRGAPGYLWKNLDEGSEKFVCVTPSSTGGKSVLRAIIQSLFLLAEGSTIPSTIIYIDKKNNQGPICRLQQPPITKGEAADILGGLVDGMMRALHQGPSVAVGAFDDSALALYPAHLTFRGDDLDAACKRRDEVAEGLIALCEKGKNVEEILKALKETFEEVTKEPCAQCVATQEGQ